MSAVLAILLALLGFNDVKEVPTEYLQTTKDGIVVINPAIAGTFKATEYDNVKANVYLIQEEAYPGIVDDVFGAN